MRYDIMTLFPQMCKSFLEESIIGRAVEKKIIDIHYVNIRDFSKSKHKKVDDYPYGGGAGMVMQAEPIYEAFQSIEKQRDTTPRVIYLSPQGKVFDHKMALELSKEKHLIFLCGHYEGVDERVIDEIITNEISIGNFVLTGGEIGAITMIDAISRLIPGVLSTNVSFEEESFFNGLLEYPQYTRPDLFLNREVPAILLSGHHQKINQWRREQSLLRTLKKRPELLDNVSLSEKEIEFLQNAKKNML